MTTYSRDSEGKFIPSTQRPDGTWRKARRVKDGYVPQEEVPLYESKGKQFAQRQSTLPPGMCPQMAEQAKKEREKQERAKAKKLAKEDSASGSGKKANPAQQPGLLQAPAATKTNTKQKNASVAKQKSKDNCAGAVAAPTNSSNAVSVDDLAANLDDSLNIPDDHDVTKKLKKLRKKLREIETIESKINSGALRKPEKDQLDKVKRKKDVIQSIKKLELEEQERTEESHD